MTPQCDFFGVTDFSGGKTARRLPIEKGDLVLGDRAYSHAAGITYVVGLAAMSCFGSMGKRYPRITKTVAG